MCLKRTTRRKNARLVNSRRHVDNETTPMPQGVNEDEPKTFIYDMSNEQDYLDFLQQIRGITMTVPELDKDGHLKPSDLAHLLILTNQGTVTLIMRTSDFYLIGFKSGEKIYEALEGGKHLIKGSISLSFSLPYPDDIQNYHVGFINFQSSVFTLSQVTNPLVNTDEIRKAFFTLVIMLVEASRFTWISDTLHPIQHYLESVYEVKSWIAPLIGVWSKTSDLAWAHKDKYPQKPEMQMLDHYIAQRRNVKLFERPTKVSLRAARFCIAKRCHRKRFVAMEDGEEDALTRLKGKKKMSAETKVIDQLTEDAMGRMATTVERKAARARGEGTSSSENKQPDSSLTLNGIHAAKNTSNNKDDLDVNAENDDEQAAPNVSDGTGPTQNDYVFDESSGEKKVRFLKGKKVKPGEEVPMPSVPQQVLEDDELVVLGEPQAFAKARSKRRNKNKGGFDDEDNRDILEVVADAELHYKDTKTLEDDGIQLEPFNLEQERKKGFFNQTGNCVEYVSNDIKDAWLDSIDANPDLAQKHTAVTNSIVEAADLSSHDIGSIKRRISDVLEPGETVLQALRRLEGSSNSRKEKMSAETQVIFDQLTEDAMKLMEDADYNVYDEKQEVFQREAEGFEKLARARGEGTSSSENKQPDSSVTLNGIHAANNTSNNEDDFDMFAENDDEQAAPNVSNGPTQNDYVFDESSGYYYSSSLGYYYDASSGLYCYAASGQWYSYNQETGAYDELPAAESNAS